MNAEGDLVATLADRTQADGLGYGYLTPLGSGSDA